MLTMQIGFNRTLLVGRCINCLVLCILSSVGPLLCCTYFVHLIYLFCTSCSTCHPSYDHRVKKTSFCYHMQGSMTLAEYSLILMFIFIAGCLCVGFELAGAICGSESCYVWTETVRYTWTKECVILIAWMSTRELYPYYVCYICNNINKWNKLIMDMDM